MGPADTAAALGSGDVEVLATPRLLAWCEAATLSAVAASGIGQDRTSVGTRVQLDHLAATGVGGRIEVTATITASDGRRCQFDVSAVDAHGRLVASGSITRVVVDRQRFAERLPPP